MFAVAKGGSSCEQADSGSRHSSAANLMLKQVMACLLEWDWPEATANRLRPTVPVAAPLRSPVAEARQLATTQQRPHLCSLSPVVATDRHSSPASDPEGFRHIWQCCAKPPATPGAGKNPRHRSAPAPRTAIYPWAA